MSAGLRTHILVALGAAIFTHESQFGFVQDIPVHLSHGDPARIAAAIVSGVGFLGGGAIVKGNGKSHGLTTAASIWLTAALGMMCASENETYDSLYVLLGVVVIVLALLVVIEEWAHYHAFLSRDRVCSVVFRLRSKMNSTQKTHSDVKKLFRKHKNSISVRSMQTCIFETSMKFTIEFEIERNDNDDKCFDTSVILHSAASAFGSQLLEASMDCPRFYDAADDENLITRSSDNNLSSRVVEMPKLDGDIEEKLSS